VTVEHWQAKRDVTPAMSLDLGDGQTGGVVGGEDLLTRSRMTVEHWQANRDVTPAMGLDLGDGQTGGVVGGEDLFDGVDVGGRAQVNASVVLHGSLHDGARRPLHGVVEA